MNLSTQPLSAALSLAVIVEILDPLSVSPPEVTDYTLERNNSGPGLPKWGASWRLVHNLDEDGGDTQHLEVTCSDRRGLEWTLNDRSGRDIASLIDLLQELALAQ